MAARVTLNGKLLHPTEYIAAEECRDKFGRPIDITLTIKSIAIEAIKTEDGEEPKPIMRFEETAKKMVLNRTNSDTIAELYGTEASAWPGKRITIYPTKVKAWGEMKACIRVRDTLPALTTTSATEGATT
jgi:hypothetical protein